MKLLLSTLLLLAGCTEQTYKPGDCLSVHSFKYKDGSEEPWDGESTVRIEMIGKKEYLVKGWSRDSKRWMTFETTIPIHSETEHYELRPCPRRD